jgi:dUTP pyrophosphatase
MQIKVKLLQGGKLPTKGTEYAAGYDLYAVIDTGRGLESPSQSFDWTTIRPGENLLIGTGVCLEIPEGYEGQVRPRSGMAKEGIVAAFGTIDSDYRGEVKVNLFNHSWKHYSVKNGNRIAQLVIQPVIRVEMVAAGELNATIRGEGGFGSSGR